MITYVPCMEWGINLQKSSQSKMKNNKKFKLLTKTTSIYLIFTFAAFFFSALFLINESGEYIEKELEGRFNWTEGRIVREIKRFGKPRRERSYVNVKKIQNISDDRIYPIYSDTLMQREEREELQLHKKKTILAEIEGNKYLIEMTLNINDFKRLQDDILEGLIPAFIILALVIVLFNLFLSGYFFSPFNKILNQMKNYKVGKRSSVSNVSTNTEEFSIMQDLFQSMVNRTEKEYSILKEYTENIAHEMQTPLTIIRNKTDNLISNEKIMDSDPSSVKIIYDEVNHLSKLGNALNLLTKVEHGEYQNSVELKTKDIIEKHVESILELADLKGITVETDLSDDHSLSIDPILFDIVMNNLIKNSINYGTAEGPIKLQTDKNCLKISNYGPPISFSENKIFSRFAKEKGSSSSLGLGLAIVHTICEKNNLEIEYKYDQNIHQFLISQKK